ncbi:hypothetical protein BASA61_005015 [Batrachochytrium salamandrivorans]|nr:hypothetical protein BASA61_005015 [Batrachochytrium salamandrivorans]
MDVSHAAIRPASAKSRTTRLPNQLAFTFLPTQSHLVNAWIVAVSSFYTNTLQHIDLAAYALYSRDATFQIEKFTLDLQDKQNMFEGNDMGDTDSITHSFIGKPSSPFQLQGPIETIAVHLVVQLISMLGHYSKHVRTGAASLIYQLASICDTNLSEKDLEKILMGLETDDKGYYSCVHELFLLTGSSLSIMSIAIVAGLEYFHNSPDWRVRGISIWNLYFSLSSIPQISSIFPDRIVVLKALHLLAPLYAVEDANLAWCIVDSLLRLKTKTPSEVEAIKSTLDVIFDCLSRKGKDGPGNETVAGISESKHINGLEMGFAIFQELISPHDEYAYDLLPWALENYILRMKTIQSGSLSTSPSSYPDSFTEFIMSLSNHFRATPPLVRYGACLTLHSTIKMCPLFVKENKSLWQFIIAGVLDTDTLSAFLYMSMVELIETSDSEELKRALSKLRRDDLKHITYDTLYTHSLAIESRKITCSDVLDIVVKHSTPVSPLLLHKLANSIDYLSPKAGLRQLELIRIWGKKAEKLDTFLIQMLSPLYASRDEEIQLKAIDVIYAMLPNMASAHPSEISFVWTYVIALLSPNFGSILLQSVFRLVESFPMMQLDNVAQKELISCLFKLIFYPDPHVRLRVYTTLGRAADFWRISENMSLALSILFLAIGDDHTQCAKAVVDSINLLGGQILLQLQIPLAFLSENINGSWSAKIKAYDQLAMALAVHKTEYQSLIESMVLYEHLDEFWRYYLADVPETQLAHPDDYNYSRNFIQCPIWISILFTKLSCMPPPYPSNIGMKRDVAQITPAGKRRLICGFMACLFPTAGMSDQILRCAACAALVRCCIRGTSVDPGMLRGLLEYVLQQMLPNKHWSFQMSALEILGLVVRLKLPGISESIMHQYLDISMSIRLQDIRDLTRVMLVDGNKNVATFASRVYPLIFRAVSKDSAATFHQYLLNEISIIFDDGLEAAGDPLVCNLSADESLRIVSLSILCIGMINDGAGRHYTIAQDLIKFLSHNNPDYRSSALAAILGLLHGMDTHESSSIIWCLIPLFGDPCLQVRRLFIRFMRNLPSLIELRCQGLPPHQDDMSVLPLISWEDILADLTTISVNSKSVQDILLDIDSLNSSFLSNDMLAEDDGYGLPTVSEKLLSRFKVLIQATTSTVLTEYQTQVIYYLQLLQKQPLLQASVIIVLSEFCCMHDTTLGELGDSFVAQLGQEILPENVTRIESCILAIYNISNNSTHAFKILLGKVLMSTTPSEGDLLSLLSLADLIKISAASRLPEILTKIISVISSSRHTLKKRLYAVFLAVELSVASGQESIKTILDAVCVLVDSLGNSAEKLQIYQAMGRILIETGPKHPFFRNMLIQAKKDVACKDGWRRLQALAVFRIFAPHLTVEDSLWFVFHYLADSNAEVRKTAKEAIALSKILEFAYTTLQRTSTPQREHLQRNKFLEMCRLPSLNRLRTSMNYVTVPEVGNEILGHTVDAFNTKYYGSERRMKFSKMYGMNETQMIKLATPIPQSFIAKIVERTLNLVPIPPETMAKMQWLLKLDSSTILHVLIGIHPNVASNIIEELLTNIESGSKFQKYFVSEDLADSAQPRALHSVNSPDEDETEIEVMTHRIDVLSNMLIAHEGVGSKTTGWMKRFQTVLSFCCDTAHSLRESLYMDMERSMYFYSEHVDIPIVSAQQFDHLENYRAASQEATLEVVKSGRVEKLSAIESQRSDMNDIIDLRSEQLRKIAIACLHLLSGCGMFYATSTVAPTETLMVGFRFISKILCDEHRGLRTAAVEAIGLIVHTQMEISPNPALMAEVDALVAVLLTELEDEMKPLYRRKSDYVTLISQMVVHIPNPDYRFRILRILVRLWRDPDSDVRVVAIRMVKYLGQAGLPEVLGCFMDTDPANRDRRPHMNIMEELSSLVGNADYDEKESLQDLLKWRFSLPFSKPTSPVGQ